jgi:ABC-type amino acid transport system permease subunit
MAARSKPTAFRGCAPLYPIVAALYFILCWPLSLLAQTLERRIDAALGLKQQF